MTLTNDQIESSRLFVRDLVQTAESLGGRVTFRPGSRSSGFIDWPDQRRRFFDGAMLDITRYASAAVARDRTLARAICTAEAIAGPEYLVFRRDNRPDWLLTKRAKARKSLIPGIDAVAPFAEKVGYPIKIKTERVGFNNLEWTMTDRNELEQFLSEKSFGASALHAEKIVAGTQLCCFVVDGQIIGGFDHDNKTVFSDPNDWLEAEHQLAKKLNYIFHLPFFMADVVRDDEAVLLINLSPFVLIDQLVKLEGGAALVSAIAKSVAVKMAESKF